MIEKDTIKGLECCLDEKVEKCDECPYSVDTFMCKRRELLEDIFELINHKQELLDAAIAGQETLQKALAEKDRIIKRLNDEKVQLIRAFSECQTEAARVLVEKDKEIERLKNELFCLANERDSIASRNGIGGLKMRDYLFRGKRIDNGEWVEGGLISVNDCEHGTVTAIIPHNCEAYRFNISGEYVIPETVGQFTGLSDKNGKEIFEGDIFKFNDEVWESYYTACGIEYDSCEVENYGVVGFDEDRLCFDFVQYKFNENSVEADLHENHDIEFADFISELEVVGNIHDNPELLKGGEEE